MVMFREAPERVSRSVMKPLIGAFEVLSTKEQVDRMDCASMSALDVFI